MSVSAWADTYRKISSEDSPEPGQWYTSRAEYQRAIMDAVSDPDVSEIVICKAAQIGGTQLLLNIAGYYIHLDPSPILWVSTTIGEVGAFSKDRFEPFRRDNPEVAEKIADPRARDGDNTILDKRFPGGRLLFRGANAPSGLRSHPIRVLICDEVDGYPPSTTEGEPVKLAEKRTVAFWNRKIIKCSTPGERTTSRIWPAYEASNKQRYHVPCPHCDHEQTLRWEQVKWDKDEKGQHLPHTAAYECEKCGEQWSDLERLEAISEGRWIAEQPEVRHISGFHVNEIMSPFVPLADMARGFLAAKNNPSLLRVWTNTALGEVWEERGDAPDHERLYERRENYRGGVVPKGGILLTAGVDVQIDRLEVEVVAWGIGLESWSVDYRVFYGEPAQDGVWHELGAFLRTPFPHELGGNCSIARVCVDTGYATHAVYDWKRRLGDNRILLVKGYDHLPQVFGRPSWVEVNSRGKVIKRGVQVWPLGVSFLKSELYSWLRLPVPERDHPAPCYCHFPQYDEEHFQQLTAEELVTRLVKGYPRREWVKVRGRNEALDARIYARAAVASLGVDTWTDDKWEQVSYKLKAEDTTPKPQPTPRKTPETSGTQRLAGWLDRGRKPLFR